ncbi:MAG: response regulator [Pricia sp.]|nr:response regulator [Pricia sp.]
MSKILSILMIEDDKIEKMKVERTMASLGLHHTIREANNGEEALEILKGSERLADIILLDLHMPKLNGVEFLQILKNDDKLKYLPVIIVTTSANYKDVKRCYEIGIAGYITKPLKYEEYVEKLKIVLDYWSLNELVTG